MQRKVHDALKEHTKRIPLRGLLEAYLRAAQEWEEARDRARSELAGEEAKMVSSLPQEADLYPWTLGLVGILERGQPIKGPSGRSYAENKGNDGTYKPSWGEFSLTRSPIRQAILTDIVEAHEKLVSTAEPYLLKLQNQHQRLKELTDQIADELDGFLLKRLVPGRCRFCPF